MVRKFFIVSLLMLSFNALFAQEYVKRKPGEKTDTSIVREIDNDYRLVYSDGYYNPVFMRYMDNNNIAINMYLPDNVRVKDFIIRHDSVYFCGWEYVPAVGNKAIFGYFDLNTFPLSTVHYYRHDGYSSFTKLETFDVHTGSASQMHVVFIASASKPQSTIVDSYMLPGNTNKTGMGPEDF